MAPRYSKTIRDPKSPYSLGGISEGLDPFRFFLCWLNHPRTVVTVTINKSVECLQTQGIPWPISVGKSFPTKTLIVSAGFFSVNGNGNFVGIRKFRGKCTGCTTRAVTKEMTALLEIRYLPRPAPARQWSLCSEAFSHPSVACYSAAVFCWLFLKLKQMLMSWKRWPFWRKNPARNQPQAPQSQPQAFYSFLQVSHGGF